jgi:hypothetical protein
MVYFLRKLVIASISYGSKTDNNESPSRLIPPSHLFFPILAISSWMANSLQHAMALMPPYSVLVNNPEEEEEEAMKHRKKMAKLPIILAQMNQPQNYWHRHFCWINNNKLPQKVAIVKSMVDILRGNIK